MKTKKILSAFLFIFLAVFMIQCEKQNGRPPGAGEGDPTSDRPPWAGGGDGTNPHQNPNPSPGITKGGDYGDLYVLLRTEDGVPIMEEFLIEDELVWMVQPVDVDGIAIGYTPEGELEDPTAVIPVDFGRLNTVRQPPSQLDAAFVEAMKVLNPDNKDVYPPTITLDFCGRLTSHYYNEELGEWVDKTIDAPRENMAIYKEIMQNLFTGRLAFLAATFSAPTDPLTIAASCFAAGSDKTGTINVDEVVYINTFMECDGLVPLVNEHEYDFEGEIRTYFDFSTCCSNGPFQYNRNMYADRYISVRLFDGVDAYVDVIVSVLEAMEDGVSAEGMIPIEGGKFTARWGSDPYLSKVEGFACAADDAVQVLDFVHGDSNIIFLPDYDPNDP